MPSSLETAGLVLAIFPLMREVWDIYIAQLKIDASHGSDSFRSNFKTLKSDYGLIPALVLLFVFPDALSVIDRIEKYILQASSEKAIMFKKVLADDCTMLAVAVSYQHA